MKKKKLYIHEDFYNLIKLLPNNKAIATSKNNMLEISDLNVFDDLSVESLDIKIEDLEKLSPKDTFIKYDKVYTGYSTQYEVKKKYDSLYFWQNFCFF